jgi:hypothetical protein
MKTKTPIIIIAILVLVGFAIYLTIENEQAKANQAKMINTDIDKIVARMNRVLDEPDAFSAHTKAQRDDDQVRLERLASSIKADIDDIIIEMKAKGYPYEDKLKKDVNMFFAVYRAWVEEKKFGYNMGDLGDSNTENKSKVQSDQMKLDAVTEISDVQSLRVDSSTLTK